MRAEDLAPRQLVDVELAHALPAVLPKQSPSGAPYTAADVLVRLHHAPLGLLRIPVPLQGISPAELGRVIGVTLTGPISEQLAACGVPPLTAVPEEGLGAICQPAEPAQSPTPVSVSVVIPTRGRPQLVGRCVDAILAGAYPPLEVLVVDNAPVDDALELVIAERYADRPEVRYLVEPLPGTSRARNAGSAVARGDLVAFIDDDAVADEWWLSVLAAEAADPTVDCVTGLVLPLALDSQAALRFEEAAGFGRGFQRRVFAADQKPAPTLLFPYTAGVCGSSNNLAVRASVLASLGGFDVRLGGGTRPSAGEDLDLLTRVLLAGHEIIYQPAAMVRHEHRSDSAAMRRQLFTYGTGATAVLGKWAAKDPELRRRLVKTSGYVARELIKRSDPRSMSVTEAGGAADEGENGREAPGGRRTSARVLAGYVCGPWLYWRETVARK